VTRAITSRIVGGRRAGLPLTKCLFDIVCIIDICQKVICFSSQQLHASSERVCLERRKKEVSMMLLQSMTESSSYAHWFAVVCQTIVPDKIEITHKLCLALVPPTLDISEHGTKIHWILDDLVVVGRISFGYFGEESRRMFL
jgi:hypothetical protein